MIRRAIRSLAPAWLYRGFVARYRSLATRRFESARRRVLDLYLARYGERVLQGPFGGLRYVVEASGSELLPKLLGTYESELHNAVEAMIARQPSTVVDIGCAEGYYAVGLACRCPWAAVHAYDINEAATALCGKLAELNGVSHRVFIHGEFTPGDLHVNLTEPVLVVCDCEGAEMKLIDPHQAPWLLRADMLIELHEYAAPGVTRTLLERFGRSHRCQLIDSVSGDGARHSMLSYLPPSHRRAAVAEMRVPMQWLVMTARDWPPQPSGSSN